MGVQVAIDLPEDLLARAQVYAAEHGTTLATIVRDHLLTLLSHPDPSLPSDPLALYSLGVLDCADAIRRLNLRNDYDLVAALARANLPLPCTTLLEEGGQRKGVVVRLVT